MSHSHKLPHITGICSALGSLLTAALVFNLMACSSATPAAEQKQSNSPTTIAYSPEQLKLMDIVVDTLPRRVMRPRVVLNGKVVVLTNYQASISSPFAGAVDQLFVKEGVPVQQGQALMSLRSLDYIQLQQDYMNAFSDEHFQHLEYERQQALLRERAGAEMELQGAQARYFTALARRKALAAKLQLTGLSPAAYEDAEKAVLQPLLTLRAPISGTVYKLPATLGLRAEPNVELARLLNLQDLHADLFAYEKDIPHIAPGQAVELSFPSQPGLVIHGKIEYLSPAVESAERYVIVHVAFEAPPQALILPEMTLQARVLGPLQVAVPAVPTEAVVREGEHSFVFITPQPKQASSLVFNKVEVKPGLTDGQYTQVSFLTPLPLGSWVVLKNALMLGGTEKAE